MVALRSVELPSRGRVQQERGLDLDDDFAVDHHVESVEADLAALEEHAHRELTGDVVPDIAKLLLQRRRVRRFEVSESETTMHGVERVNH